MLEFLVSAGVHEDRLSWTRLHELVCSRPAREAGIYPRKGSIQEGTDADIVIIREDQFTVSADDLQYVGGWTPYEGREWSARVDTVISGTATLSPAITRSGLLPGRGEFLPRP